MLVRNRRPSSVSGADPRLGSRGFFVLQSGRRHTTQDYLRDTPVGPSARTVPYLCRLSARPDNGHSMLHLYSGGPDETDFA